MKTRMTIVAMLSALSISAQGCFLWHHDKSPQQQYAEALMRGNSMQASQIWLNMSPEERAKFSRGEAIAPDPASADQVKRQIVQHYQDETPDGPSSAEEMEQQVPTSLGASLQRLPAAAASQPPNN